MINIALNLNIYFIEVTMWQINALCLINLMHLSLKTHVVLRSFKIGGENKEE